MTTHNGNPVVYIDHNPVTLEVDIYLGQRFGPDGTLYLARPTGLIFEKHEFGVGLADPTFRLPGEIWLPAFAEAIDKMGVKTEKDATIQGRLDAQSYHLEDLRKLLKLVK